MYRPQGITERYPAHYLVPMLDGLALVIGATLAHGLRFGHFDMSDRYWLAVVIMIFLITFINNSIGAYERWRITRISSLLSRQFLVWLAVRARA